MDCAACGRDNPERAKFCLECGSPFAAACAQCGTELPTGSRFCLECGTAVAAPLGEATARRPRDYTPKHLAERILQSRAALEGERKNVTVMFADVKGSMDLAEQLGAEAWHSVLDRFFQILGDAVHRFEGTINQYTGDGIMALFGAPLSHEDHGHRACYAALHLRDTLRDFTHEIKRRHAVDFAVRIGLNSGEVVVGKIGDDLRMDYTAQGHTVGLAQRMEALASGGSIYAGASTATLVRGYFDLEDLGEFSLKGASEVVRVFELQGLGSAKTRFDLSRARGLTRFVGRANETALLDAALDQALEGPGRSIGIVAQAGTGKSRLSFEFVEACRARGLPVFEARGLSHGRQIPMLPVVELMRDFFGIDERDSDRVAREKIAGRALLLDSALEEELPIFFDLLAVPDPARPLPDIDPDLLQRRMYAALRTIVRADGELAPGVLLVEDLHWLDPASDAVLEQILEANAESRGLVVLNFRPEYRAHWMQQPHYQQLSLLPLSADALRDLLRDLLGEHPSVAKLPDAIHERTGGNPFFIEEVVQSLVDEGHLAGERGSYTLVTEVTELPAPESVQAILAARIDRLPEREKRVLQTAAVIGKTFSEEMISHVVGMLISLPDHELQDALRHLQNAEFILEAALYPKREFTFKHPLTQEVADGSQLSETRMRAHAAVARALEERAGDEHATEQAALLAHHWEEAGEPATAARWHACAGERIGPSSFTEALHHWRRVDELLQTVPAGQDPDIEAARRRAPGRLLIGAFRMGMELDEAGALFARGQQMLEASGDARGSSSLITSYAAVLQGKGDLRTYRQLMQQGADLATASGDPIAYAILSLDHGYALQVHGALEAAVEAADRGIAATGGDPLVGIDELGYSPLILNLAFACTPLAQMGRFEEADERMRRAHVLAAEHASAESMAWMSFVRAEVEFIRGEPETGLRHAEQSAAMAERSGSGFDAVASSCWLSVAHAECGNWQEVITASDRARAGWERVGSGLDMVIVHGWAVPLARLHLGEVDLAKSLADEAVARCEEQELGIGLIRSLIVRAAVFREQGDGRSAEADLVTAARVARRCKALQLLGAIHEARGEKHEALALYEELGATGHVRRLAAELGG